MKVKVSRTALYKETAVIELPEELDAASLYETALQRFNDGICDPSTFRRDWDGYEDGGDVLVLE